MKKGVLAAILLISATMAMGRSWTTRTDIKVLDADGNPVPNADYDLSFDTSFNANSSQDFSGKTDSNGMIRIETTSGGCCDGDLTKEGWYTSIVSLKKFPENLASGASINFATNIVMQRKINPVPMYAKAVDTYAPKLNEPIGFDFKIGDWLKPYGKGETSDIVFKFNSSDHPTNEFYAVELEISFPDEQGGIIEMPGYPDSTFKSPHAAPTNGFHKALKHGTGRRQNTGRFDTQKSETECNYYIFRTMSTASTNEPARLCFGKLVCPIVFDLSIEEQKAYLAFKYYFNPNGTRNLEFDPERNLLLEGKPWSADVWQSRMQEP